MNGIGYLLNDLRVSEKLPVFIFVILYKQIILSYIILGRNKKMKFYKRICHLSIDTINILIIIIIIE